MSLTRSAIHRFRYIIYHTISPPLTNHTFQSQLHRSFLSHPIPKPFHFHSSSYSSSSSSSCSTFVRGGADDDYPTGDFDFKPVTGFNKFLVKLKMLIALPWERVQHGSVLKIILRGQVFLPTLPLTSQFSYFLSFSFFFFFLDFACCCRYLIN